MATLPRPAALGLSFLLASGAWTLAAGGQPQDQAAPLPVSVDRIRAGVQRAPAFKIDVPLPVPRFRTRTDERVWMVPFDEYLRKELELTPLQRQSADWASRCCGFDLGGLFDEVEKAWERRKARQIRERSARELKELEAARDERGRDVK